MRKFVSAALAAAILGGGAAAFALAGGESAQGAPDAPAGVSDVVQLKDNPPGCSNGNPNVTIHNPNCTYAP